MRFVITLECTVQSAGSSLAADRRMWNILLSVIHFGTTRLAQLNPQ